MSNFVNRMVKSLREFPLLHFMNKPKLNQVDEYHYKKDTDDENITEKIDETIEIFDEEANNGDEIIDIDDESPTILKLKDSENDSDDLISIIDAIKERDQKEEKDKYLKKTIKHKPVKFMSEEEISQYKARLLEQQMKLKQKFEREKLISKMADIYYKAALQATGGDLDIAKNVLVKKRSLLDVSNNYFYDHVDAIDSAIYKIEDEIAKKHGEFGSSQTVYEKKVVKF